MSNQEQFNYLKILPSIATAIIILLVVFLAFLVLKPFLFVIITAFVFAVFLSPFYNWLNKRLKKKSLSAFLTILFLILFVFLPIIFIFTNLLNEARKTIVLLQTKPVIIDNFQMYLTNLAESYGISLQDINLHEQLIGFLRAIARNVGNTILHMFTFFLNALLVFITIFFFLVQKERILKYLVEIKFIPERYFVRFQERTIELINGIVRGNLIVIAIQAAIGATGFLIFGIPFPVLLGLVYGLLSLIPSVGVLLVWIPVTALTYFLQGPKSALLLISWFVLSNLTIDNFISPRIIGGQTRLHQLLVMFSVIGGIQQFGIVGIVVGPVIVALSFLAIDIYKELVEG